MTRTPQALLALVFLTGCSSSSSTLAPSDAAAGGDAVIDALVADSGHDRSDVVDDSRLFDGPSEDGAGDSNEQDSNSTDSSTTDVVRHWDAGGLPYGQCVNHDDCYFALPCDLGPPGGMCTCSLPDECGDPLEYDCDEGRCHRLCPHGRPCPLGMSCDPAHQWCVPSECSTTTPCVAPYVCETGQCRRPACSSGKCPPGMSCESGICIELYE